MNKSIHERSFGGDMENHTFEIRGKFYKSHCFPGLNEYIKAIGANPRQGNSMKQDYQTIACNAIRLGLKRFKTKNPIILHYAFKEPEKGQRRDRMNVFSFADKVIEDALQKCGVIEDDDPAHVVNTTHDFSYTKGQPAIIVTIEELVQGKPLL